MDGDPEGELETPWLPCHIPHLAVGGGEYPLRVDQHASTVELIAFEQGHLPDMGAPWTWNSINNSVLSILSWMETWRKAWVASMQAKQRNQQTDGQRQRYRERQTERRGEGQRQKLSTVQRKLQTGMGTDGGSLLRVQQGIWSGGNPRG